MSQEIDRLLEKAITAARSGDKLAAKKLLSDTLQKDSQDARIWYLLSQVVDQPNQAIHCLEKVLELQPDNSQVKEKLERLRNKTILPELDLSVNPQKIEKPKNKTNQNLILGIATLAVFLCVCLAVIMMLPKTTKPNPQAKSIEDLNYFEIRANHKTMTGVQWEEYQKSIMGKRVQWQGFVSEIKSDIVGDNYIWVDMDNPQDGNQDLFFAYPAEKSLKYSKGDWIIFNGEFDGSDDFFFFALKLENAEIIQ